MTSSYATHLYLRHAKPENRLFQGRLAIIAMAITSSVRLPKKTRSNKDRLYLYTAVACQSCQLKQQCTASKQRWVTRHFEEDALTEVADSTATNPMIMRRRSGMVEHPFGTLKRRMDGGRFLVRGLQKVKAEMALAATQNYLQTRGGCSIKALPT